MYTHILYILQVCLLVLLLSIASHSHMQQKVAEFEAKMHMTSLLVLHSSMVHQTTGVKALPFFSVHKSQKSSYNQINMVTINRNGILPQKTLTVPLNSCLYHGDTK